MRPANDMASRSDKGQAAEGYSAIRIPCRGPLMSRGVVELGLWDVGVMTDLHGNGCSMTATALANHHFSSSIEMEARRL